MTRTRASKRIISLLVFLLAAIISAGFCQAAVSNHYINTPGSNIYTDVNLRCHWTLDQTTTANVSWYRNGQLNSTEAGISCSASADCTTTIDIPASYTVKGDSWGCSVSYYNGSADEQSNISVSVLDSSPTSPRIYLQGGAEITNGTIAEIAEDAATVFNITSTDADGDVITYSLIESQTTYCSINAASGILTCTPTLETQIGLKNITLGATASLASRYTIITLNVTPTNDAPRFVSLPDRSMREYEALNYSLTGTDDESNSPYYFSVSSDLSALIIINTSATTARIMFNNSGQDNATYWDNGNHTISVTIIDSDPIDPRNYTETFNLEVIPLNHKAQLGVLPEVSGIEGGSLLAYFMATDLNNDTITFFTNSSLYNITKLNQTSNASGSIAYGLLNITNLTNAHVANRYISIIAYDTKENNSLPIFLNITNINNDPELHRFSNNSQNTLSNYDMDNLTAYTGVLFRYAVNASDPDDLTYDGANTGLRNYTINDSSMSINATTGLWTFTLGTVGTRSVLITVTDGQGVNSSRVAIVNVLPNTLPSFNQSMPAFDCYEYDLINYQYNCTYNVSRYAIEVDAGDSIVLYETNSTLFTIDNETGYIEFTATQDMIGNYPVRIDIYDSRGGSNYTVLNMTVHNTNNPPTLNNILLPRIVAGTTLNYVLSATDYDLESVLTNESLQFNSSIAGPNTTLFTMVKTSNSTASLSFTPSVSDVGDYTVDFTVTDAGGNFSRRVVAFTIYNTTADPQIIQIRPFGSPLEAYVNSSWANASLFPNLTTRIVLLENTTYIFNQTSSADNSSYTNSLNYSWYYDGALISQAQGISRSFDFFSSGSHNISFVATDEFYSDATFVWQVEVINVNRPPVLLNPLPNLTVQGTTQYLNYMSFYNNTKYMDPDDDTNSNWIFDGSEGSTLTYSSTTCDYATFSFSGTSMTVHTKDLGACDIVFTATDALDSGLYALSNHVIINITSLSNDSSEPEPVYVSGGGGSSTRTVTVPIPEEVEKPRPLQIIAPKLVTIYKNSTIKIPIILNNTWNDTLQGVTLYGQANVSNVTFYFDRTYFPRIYNNRTEQVELTITNYKAEGHYEFNIFANITDPVFLERATIFIHSAEMKSQGDELENRISFARDLLSSNPECQELNELLNEAKKELDNNNYVKTAQMIDDVVNGCKYLVSNAQHHTEQPQREFIKRFEWKTGYNKYAAFAIFGILLIASLFYIFKKENAYDF